METANLAGEMVIIKSSSNDSKINNIETWADAFITYEIIYTIVHLKRCG